MTKRAIKLENGYFLDTSSIVHDKDFLSNIINQYKNRKILEFKGNAKDDLNNYYTPGIYGISGDYKNCYTSSTTYGVMLVLTNDGGVWRKTDPSSWLWQFVFTTGGGIYMRCGVNSTIPDGWRQIH